MNTPINRKPGFYMAADAADLFEILTPDGKVDLFKALIRQSFNPLYEHDDDDDDICDEAHFSFDLLRNAGFIQFFYEDDSEAEQEGAGHDI